ncbi:MAG: POTRA domain-containing protein, partial [Bacteroidales bacterium]
MTLTKILPRHIISLFPKLGIITLLCIFGLSEIHAQEINVGDTIIGPKVNYSLPRKYEIAGITVTGGETYDDYVIIGFSGLTVGETITIPGDDITTAIRRFWKQGLFSDVAITLTKTVGNKAWLNIVLKQQPRVSEIRYHGIKKSDKDELEGKIGITRGGQITPNLIDRADKVITKFYDEKGYKNAEVKIIQHPDLSRENNVIVDIVIDKKSKVKVHKIYISGNKVLSTKKVKHAMKKTNEKGDILRLFNSKKFINEQYREDLKLIIDKYNEFGFRDARIVSDSIVPYNEKTVDVYINIEEGNKYYIKSINWVGNTIYPSEILSQTLRMKAGDVYNQKLLRERTMEDEDAVANSYMNNGYLFFQLDPVEVNITNDSIDLELRIYEGPQARINRVIIRGNDRLYEDVVRRELRTRPGELFSKEDLMRSAREIAQMGHFNPETMDIRPEPNSESGTVDIIYGLESKPNDQIEFSAGWGQTGIVGKLSLKFTNFSFKNLFNPKSYKGIIPQGEGQQFSISAQTNARYYQSYSVSFLDPWFMGKRPNSFSFSAYYSRQTDVSSSYYNNNYYDPYSYGYYNNNNYNNNNYDYGYSYDPDKSLQMFGVTIGFGKRLTWPDDYFQFTAQLSYQLYVLKDWQYLYYMQNGKSHSITVGLTLSRNSMDNPLFTRRGSEFLISCQLTPPYSLWENIDYAKATPAEKYKWIEYHKWKIKGKVYLPLTRYDKKYTLVLMARAEAG